MNLSILKLHQCFFNECLMDVFLSPVKEINSLISEEMSNIYFKSDSGLPKNGFFICFSDSSSKMMENTFSFHLKSSFLSQDI